MTHVASPSAKLHLPTLPQAALVKDLVLAGTKAPEAAPLRAMPALALGESAGPSARSSVGEQEAQVEDARVARTAVATTLSPLASHALPELPLMRNPTMWQSLIAHNLSSVDQSMFTRAAQSYRGAWDKNMAEIFLNEAQPHVWQMVPMAGFYAHKWLAEGEGPLIELKPEQHFGEMWTDKQYMVKLPAARQRAVAALAESFGSFLSFHGSPTSSWHQILLQGLENNSSTSMQRNGSAHGNGIYLSDDTWIPRGFCRGDTAVLGVAEVLKLRSTRVQRHQAGNLYTVAADRMAVVIRYIFVYPDGVGSIPTNAHVDNLDEQHKKLIAEHYGLSAENAPADSLTSVTQI